jgi:ATP-dependent DNA helicase RecG
MASAAQPESLLSRPVSTLKGVGPRVAAHLERLGITAVRDLLFHLPIRYQDRTRVTPIGALRPFADAQVEATIELTQVQFGRRRALLCRVSDGTGALTLRFFHFTRAQQDNLRRGVRLRCYGEVRPGPMTLEMIHPEYQRVDQRDPAPVEDRLTPVYPITQGLHQANLRRLIAQALECLARPADVGPELDECVPGDAAIARAPSLTESLRYVHRPPPGADVEALAARVHPAQRRLAFDELLAHHLSLRQRRTEVAHRRAPVLGTAGELSRAFLARLGFELTAAQRRVAGEIYADLARPVPMMRLVQGDVGSGKTVVAALAALCAIEAGRQAALMAPTELLAEQHLRTFRRWFEPLGVRVLWLSGKVGRGERARVLTGLAQHGGAIVIGTHALFQEPVVFANLALVIVDEQHRFGVHQRLLLRDKGASGDAAPHQLIMTATPIPRTLAMVGYADLDNSVIDELPPGRQPVQTSVIPDTRRAEIIERMLAARRDNRQIYWVCTLIEESESLQCQAATDTAAELAASLPGVRVGLVHGRLKPADKDEVMLAFARRDLDLLVATTVIEVGVDIPNASLMIIENPERLGLAQLHQLRGRVGRGTRQSDCILLYHAPLSELARQRLAIIRETSDGFAIAERDLALRGPGELLGTRQAGALEMKVADLARDADLLEEAVRIAERLLRDHPGQAQRIVNRWLANALHYVEA